jgi:hypothetical protein
MALAATLIPKPKPPRDYPNMNAILGIRGTFNVDLNAPGLGIVPGKYVLLGTIQGRSSIISAQLVVTTGGLAAGATYELLTANDISATVLPQSLLPATSLDAAGSFFPTGTEPALGYSNERRYVFGRLTSALPLTAGRWDAIVRYYTKFD